LLFEHGVFLTRVEVWETRKCSAVAEL
jgi:hypothetical protein